MYSIKPFFYNIAGFTLNLEEIKHGLLRNNMKSPKNYMKTMSTSDTRLNLLKDFEDPRINFVCLDYPNFLEHIDTFEGTTDEVINENLDQFVQDMINAKVDIDLE